MVAYDALIEPHFTVMDGFRRCLPVAAVVGVFGMSFGVLARASGFPLLAPIVMSLTTFGGSAQLGAASVLGDGGSVAAATVAAIFLNARYATVGLAVAPVLKGSPLRRLFQAQLVVDEGWAIATSGGKVNRELFLGAGLAIFVFWNAGTVIGTLAGDLVGNPNDLGLDAAFPALFLTLLVSRLGRLDALVSAVVGAAIALALVPFTPPGVPMLAASLGALACWRRRP